MVIAVELEGGQNSLVTIAPWCGCSEPAAAGLCSVERGRMSVILYLLGILDRGRGRCGDRIRYSNQRVHPRYYAHPHRRDRADRRLDPDRPRGGGQRTRPPGRCVEDPPGRSACGACDRTRRSAARCRSQHGCGSAASRCRPRPSPASAAPSASVPGRTYRCASRARHNRIRPPRQARSMSRRRRSSDCVRPFRAPSDPRLSLRSWRRAKRFRCPPARGCLTSRPRHSHRKSRPRTARAAPRSKL